MKKSKDKWLQNSIMREMTRIKKMYCANCECFIDDKCSKGKLYKKCFEENRKN